MEQDLPEKNLQQEGVTERGTLYVVPTPIGNLGDMTTRGLQVLREVDFIACEDTRVSGNLFRHYGISSTLIACHDHNEEKRGEEICDLLRAGKKVAIVSDAGTPAISDPGFRVVRACRKAGLPVVALPGACAVTTALSASGLPSDGFLFAGFLPPKSAARARFFEQYIEFPYTLILYESCHRITKFMSDLENVIGSERIVCVGRELTKRFETIHTGTVNDVRKKVETGSQKGEFVILIAKSGYVL